MLVTLFGIVISVNPTQPAKALLPILAIIPDNVILLILLHPLNALSPIAVSPVIVTSVNVEGTMVAFSE